MPSFFDPAERERAIGRLARLRPDAAPRWGSLSAPAMLAHLIDAFAIGAGERQVAAGSGVLALPPVRWLVLRMPLPKGRVTAPPVFHQTPPGDFERDRELVVAGIRRFAAGRDQRWGVSPIFGRLRPAEWARLQAVHTDHHLRQFGC